MLSKILLILAGVLMALYLLWLYFGRERLTKLPVFLTDVGIVVLCTGTLSACMLVRNEKQAEAALLERREFQDNTENYDTEAPVVPQTIQDADLEEKMSETETLEETVSMEETIAAEGTTSPADTVPPMEEKASAAEIPAEEEKVSETEMFSEEAPAAKPREAGEENLSVDAKTTEDNISEEGNVSSAETEVQNVPLPEDKSVLDHENEQHAEHE